MSDWSSRRKFSYVGVAMLFLVSISFFIFWKFWYTAPLCSDGFQNGDESGIDCGGSCSLICPAEALRPITKIDPRIFQIYKGVYSVITMVENRNTNSSATNIPYKFSFFDADNTLIYERKGLLNLPKNRVAAVFEGNISLDKVPARVAFQISPIVPWMRDDTVPPDIDIQSSPLLNADTAPKINASIENKTNSDFKNIDIVATVLDGRDNIVAASRTFLNTLKMGQKSDIFFTWPASFSLGEYACENQTDTELLIDRSGSMSSLGKNPPEPLSSVKNAAVSFVSNLNETDKAGVISFASTADELSLGTLSSDITLLKTKINSIEIAKSGTQYTNIFDALNKASQALSLEEDESVKKVVVLLTDGVANKPGDPKGGASEAEDITYAEAAALSEAGKLKGAKAAIYTIGLGKDIHEDFLKKIASGDGFYYHAPGTSDLKNIYREISSAICKEKPTKIEFFYDIKN